MIRFYRSKWLKRQNLDIAIPAIKLGIEYDGRQHFKSVEYFGGTKGFFNTVLNDQRKERKCQEAGWTLLRIPYYMPEEEWEPTIKRYLDYM